MYADDTHIYIPTTFNELPNTLKEINSITTKLENYFNYNYLKFNLQNTEYIIYHLPLYIKILTSAYIISILDYCNSLLINIPNIQEKRLNKIINHTWKLIFKLPKRTHSTLYRKKLNF